MVCSYYDGHMQPEELHDVIHVDYYVGNNAIQNLAPLRNLEELQYLLHNIANLEWRVAVSKHHDDLSRYLVSENGMVFSLIRKIFETRRCQRLCLLLPHCFGGNSFVKQRRNRERRTSPEKVPMFKYTFQQRRHGSLMKLHPTIMFITKTTALQITVIATCNG